MSHIKKSGDTMKAVTALFETQTVVEIREVRLPSVKHSCERDFSHSQCNSLTVNATLVAVASSFSKEVYSHTKNF